MLTRRIYAVKPRIGGSGVATVRGSGGGIFGRMRRRHGIGQERNDMFFGLCCRLGSICCRANGSGFTRNGGRWNNRHRRRLPVRRGIHHGALAYAERARGNRHNPCLYRCCGEILTDWRHTHRRGIVHFVAHSRHLPIRGVRFVRFYGIIRGISPSTIGTEALIERASQLLHPFFRIEEALFFGIRDETHLREHRRHRSGTEHQETGLVHPFIFASLIAISRLNVACKLHTLLHIAILHELKDDVTLRLVGIEVLVNRAIIGFLRDHTVLSLGHSEVFLAGVHADGVRLRTGRRRHAGGHGIGVDRHKKMGLVAIGDVGTSLKCDEHVAFARVNHLHVRAVVFHQAPKGQCNTEVDVFLFRYSTRRPVVLPAVSGIDDENKARTSALRRCGSGNAEGKTQQDDEHQTQSGKSQNMDSHDG